LRRIRALKPCRQGICRAMSATVVRKVLSPSVSRMA
jgi:hypothetical protein